MQVEKHKKYSISSFIAFSFILLLFRIAYVYSCGFDLYADEAQYYYWSQHLSYGYYSKPPVIAWIIALSTKLFDSNSEFAIRFLSPIIYFLTSIIVYKIAKQLFDKKVAWYSAILFYTMPAMNIASVLISTDAPLLFFYALSFYCYIKASQAKQYWFYLGITIGLGMLSKYNMGLFAIGIFIHQLIITKNLWHVIRNLFIPGIVSFLIFLPNIIWNFQHELVSLKHTAEISKIDKSFIYPIKFIEFIAAQFLMAGPVLYYYFIKNIKTSMKKNILLLILALSPLLPIAVLSLTSGANANWAFPSVIGIIILAVYTLRDNPKMLKISLIINLLSIVIFGALSYLPINDKVFYRIKGHKQFGEQILKISNANPEYNILFDERKSIAWALYYSHVEEEKLHKFNLSGTYRDHFDMIMGVTEFDTDNQKVIIISRFEKVPDKYLDLYPKLKRIKAIEVSNIKHRKYYVYKNFAN